MIKPKLYPPPPGARVVVGGGAPLDIHIGAPMEQLIVSIATPPKAWGAKKDKAAVFAKAAGMANDWLCKNVYTAVKRAPDAGCRAPREPTAVTAGQIVSKIINQAAGRAVNRAPRGVQRACV